MKRAVAWELLAWFAFLCLVALHAERDSCRGWPTRTIRELLDPVIDTWRWSRPWWGLALQALALRWVLWAWRGPGPLPWTARGRALAGAALGVLVAGAVCWSSLAWWIGCPYGGLDVGLSRAYLLGESVLFLGLALTLATAPAGLLVALARRPAHAALVGAGLGLGTLWFMSWSCRVQHGWGRVVLLGLGAALGAAVGARPVASAPSAPPPTASRRDLAVLLALAASVGWPGRACLLAGEGGTLLGRLLTRDVLQLWPVDAWIVQVLLACHLARAWRARRGPLGEALLCGAVALQLLPTLGLLVPETVVHWVPDDVLVRPRLAVTLSLWGALALGLVVLRRAGERSVDSTG